MPQKPNYEKQKVEFLEKMGQIPNKGVEKFMTRFYPGDLVTRVCDREIGVISRRVGLYALWAQFEHSHTFPLGDPMVCFNFYTAL